MAITRVGFTAPVSAVTGNTLTLTEPTGCQQGDVIFAWMAIRNPDSFQTPSGWTKLQENATGNNLTTTSGSCSFQLFYTVRGASAPTLVFTGNQSVSNLWYGRTVAYRGVDTTNPIVASGSARSSISVSSVSISGVSAQAGEAILACFAGGNNDAVSLWSLPSNTLTEFCDNQTTDGSDTTNAMADTLNAVAISNQSITINAAASALHGAAYARMRVATSTPVVLAGAASVAFSGAGDLTTSAGSVNKYLQLEAAADQQGYVASTSDTAGSRTIQLKSKVTSQAKGGSAPVDDCPSIFIGTDIGLVGDGAYWFQFMTIGLQIFKRVTGAWVLQDDSYDAAHAMAVGAQHQVKIAYNGTNLQLFFDDMVTPIKTIAETGLRTGRFGIAALACTVQIDDISGTIAENFNGRTTGSYAFDQIIGDWQVKSLGGGSVQIVESGGAVLVGGATLSAAGAGSLTTQATFTGAAAITATASGNLAAQARFTGAASTGVTGSGSLTAQARLAGAAAIAATGASVLTAQAKFVGAAALAANATGTLTARALLVGSANIAASGSGTIATQILFRGAAVATFSAAGDFSGSAAQLVGAAALGMSASAALSTSIHLAGEAALGMTGAGTFRYFAELSGAAVMQSTATGVLATSIRLAGSAQMAVQAYASLLTRISLQGDASLFVGGDASLQTAILLSGGADFGFTASGILTGGVYVVPTVRAWVARAQDRRWIVPFQQRELAVAAQDRSITINPQQRAFDVSAQDREFDVPAQDRKVIV